MPTGYTANIEKGISFKEYALQCARAFGALIHMRDDPFNAPIPKQVEIDTYHFEALVQTNKKLEEFEMLSESELSKQYKSSIEEIKKANEKIQKEKSDLKAKYEAMLEQVKAYVPPSDDHISYKQFMIEQIKDSIEWDCKYHSDEIPSFDKWKQNQLNMLKWSVAYHEKSWKEEQERAKDRTEWLEKLHKSLENV